MKNTYTIGELAELAGVSTKTLRVYERKGLLLPGRNTDNHYRMYTEEAVRKLEQIQLMKYLGFSLEQIQEFLSRNEASGREEMLRKQKRLLQKKRAQLDSVIACVDRAVAECREKAAEDETFLHNLGSIVKNQKSDELVGRLGMHSDEPRGWSEFIFDRASLSERMRVLDAGAGYGNLWRYNLYRLPKDLHVICVDKHNTHADGFCEFVKEREASGELAPEQISFVWEDLELRKYSEKYHCIFFNHVASFIRDRVSLYRKFRDSLLPGGTFICTWGGLLINENAAAVLNGFLDDAASLVTRKKKFEITIRRYEKELYEAFGSVERQAYVITLRFENAEDYMDYLIQVCRPVEAELEERREEFLAYLRRFEDADGCYTFVRDTYLYLCKGEV